MVMVICPKCGDPYHARGLINPEFPLICGDCLGVNGIQDDDDIVITEEEGDEWGYEDDGEVE